VFCVKESTRRKIARLVAENVHSQRVESVTAELLKLVAEAAADERPDPAPAAE
jgi:hypothetical protein